MARKIILAFAYYRTSSSTNVGSDKDSLPRQQSAVHSYAARNSISITAEFYDPAVSGADPVDKRPGFLDLLNKLAVSDVRMVLIEDATRFARDLAVQLAGHDRLKAMGIELVPVNAPDHFREDTPTAVLVRQVLGAISQFDKATIVAKLKDARDRKRAATGRCEGRKPVPEIVVKVARRLARKSPKTGERRSLRGIAGELAKLGYVGPGGQAYGPESIKRMLAA